MALTTDQLSDLQVDLGISDDESVFTDAELNRLFTRAQSNYDATVALAFRQLRVQAARFTKYTQGQSSEDKTAIFKQLGELQHEYEQRGGISGGSVTTGSVSVNFLEDDPDALS